MIVDLTTNEADLATTEAEPTTKQRWTLLDDAVYAGMVARRDELAAQTAEMRGKLAEVTEAVGQGTKALATGKNPGNVVDDLEALDRLNEDASRLKRALDVLERAEASLAKQLREESGRAGNRVRQMARPEFNAIGLRLDAALEQLDAAFGEYKAFVNRLSDGEIDAGEFTQIASPYWFGNGYSLFTGFSGLSTGEETPLAVWRKNAREAGIPV
jgi:hypothetical protein